MPSRRPEARLCISGGGLGPRLRRLGLLGRRTRARPRRKRPTVNVRIRPGTEKSLPAFQPRRSTGQATPVNRPGRAGSHPGPPPRGSGGRGLRPVGLCGRWKLAAACRCAGGEARGGPGPDWIRIRGPAGHDPDPGELPHPDALPCSAFPRVTPGGRDPAARPLALPSAAARAPLCPSSGAGPGIQCLLPGGMESSAPAGSPLPGGHSGRRGLSAGPLLLSEPG